MSNCPLILKVKIWPKILISLVSMTAILNSELTKSLSELSVSSSDSPSSKT